MHLLQGFKGLNDWWRYIVSILLVFLFYFIGQTILYVAVILKSDSYEAGVRILQQFENNMDFSVLNLSKNLVFFLLIIMFVFAVAALYVAVKYIHKKQFLHLITAKPKINYLKILFGFSLWFILSILLEGINYINDPNNYTLTFNGDTFFMLVVISLVFLPIQSSFEELFFRGYILQALAFFTKNTWAALILSSIFFGLVHWTNPEAAKYGTWTMQTYYIMAGLILGLITILDGSLELALGVHAATNIFGATLFSYDGSVIQTDSVFTSQEINPYIMILAFFIAGIAFMIICSKKYGWNFQTLYNSSLTHPSIDV